MVAYYVNVTAGLKCANALSTVCTVVSLRDGTKKTMIFNEGYEQETILDKIGKSVTGTIVEFNPNKSIIGDYNVTFDDVYNLANTLSYISGVKIIVQEENNKDKIVKEKIVQHKGKIVELLCDIAPNQMINPIYLESEGKDSNDKDVKVEAALTYVDDFKKLNLPYDEVKGSNNLIISYANFCTTIEGGSHVKGFTQGLTDTMKDFVTSLLSEKEKKKFSITGNDVKEGLVCVISSKLVQCEFIGQVKEKLDAPNATKFITKAVSSGLKKWIKEDSKEASALAKWIKTAAEIRAKASEEKKTIVRERIGKGFLDRPDNIKHYCQANTDGSAYEGIEIYIVEGESAYGSCKQACNKEFQEIFGVRGVGKNGMDSNGATMMDNQEFKSLTVIIGGGGLGKKFDLKKVRVARVYILTDADLDGGKIGSLLGVQIGKYMSPLVQAGMLYYIQPPLYKIKKGNEEYFVSSDAEYAELIKKEMGNSIIIHKAKKNKQGDKLNSKEMIKLIETGTEYNKFMIKAMKKHLINGILFDHCSSIADLFEKGDEKKINQHIKKLFPFISYNKKTKFIKGTNKTEYEVAYVGKKFVKDLKKLDSITNGVDSYYYDENRGLMHRFELFAMFKSYEPKNKTRFKGLGEMNAKDIEKTLLTPGNRKVVQITMDDVEAELETLKVLHSGKAKYVAKRKEIVSKFEIDPDEIDS